MLTEYAAKRFLFPFSLSRCGLTDNCCAELASLFVLRQSNIKELDLSDNNLQDKGAKKFCVGLKSPQCKLEKLL